MKRTILISFPKKNVQKIITFEDEGKSLYYLVEQVRKLYMEASEIQIELYGSYSLSEVMPIHNLSGVRDASQIKQMQEKISSGEEVFEKDGLPNIKLVVAPNNKLLIFDGTHTLIAYLLQGKRLLSSVPYLVISADKFAPVTAQEISTFFPEESREKIESKWSEWVVNWQAELGSQTEKREFNTMGELALVLSKGDKGSIEH